MIVASGTEDFFMSSLYFAGGVFRSENAGLTDFRTEGYRKEVSAYRTFTNDPMPFIDGMELVWRNGDTTVAGTGIKCTTEHGPAAGGDPGDPQPANATTLTWLYVTS